jgi:hypothetical protein
VRSRLLKTTVLAAVAGAIWTQMPQVTLRWNSRRWLSWKCCFLGHEDWIRRTPDRLYPECFECGRETRMDHRQNSAIRSCAKWPFQATPTRTRKGHAAPASVQSPIGQSLRGASIADDRDLTIAA